MVKSLKEQVYKPLKDGRSKMTEYEKRLQKRNRKWQDNWNKRMEETNKLPKEEQKKEQHRLRKEMAEDLRQQTIKEFGFGK